MIGTIADIIRDMEHGVYDFTVNGECSQCGGCCSDLLPVSSKEIKEIRRYVKKHHIKECIHRLPVTETTFDLTCPFRDDEKKICTIYAVRPAICRDFQCDKPRNKIELNKQMYHGRYAAVSMRETFLGEGSFGEIH